MEQKAEYYYKRAEERFRRDDVKGGFADLDEAIRLDPANSDYYWARGFGRYQQDEYELALVDFAKAVELTSDLTKKAEVYESRVSCHRHLQQHENVISDATWLIDNGFNDAWVYEFRAYSKRKIRDFEGAIQDYAIAQQLSPRTDILLQRANTYFEAKRFRETIEELTLILSSDETNSDFLSSAYYWRGKAHYALNEQDKALQDFNEQHRLLGQKPFSSAVQFMELIERVEANSSAVENSDE